MDARIKIIAVLAALALLLVVLELVRRRRLLERYALLWLLSAGVILILAIWTSGLNSLAKLLGIASSPNALFFVAIGFVLFLLLHFSVAISRLSDQVTILAQRQAILDERGGAPSEVLFDDDAGDLGAQGSDGITLHESR